MATVRLGVASVDIQANSAQFTAGLARARRGITGFRGVVRSLNNDLRRLRTASIGAAAAIAGVAAVAQRVADTSARLREFATALQIASDTDFSRLQNLQRVFEGDNVSVQTFRQSILVLQRNLSKPIVPRESLDSLDQLGLSLDSLLAGSTIDAFEDVLDAVRNLNQAGGNIEGIVASLFGRGGIALLPTINALESIDELVTSFGAKFDDLNLTLGDAQELKNLDQALADIGDTISISLARAVASSNGTLTALVDNLRNFLIPTFQTIITFGNSVAENFRGLLEPVIILLTALFLRSFELFRATVSAFLSFSQAAFLSISNIASQSAVQYRRLRIQHDAFLFTSLSRTQLFLNGVVLRLRLAAQQTLFIVRTTVVAIGSLVGALSRLLLRFLPFAALTAITSILLNLERFGEAWLRFWDNILDLTARGIRAFANVAIRHIETVLFPLASIANVEVLPRFQGSSENDRAVEEGLAGLRDVINIALVEPFTGFIDVGAGALDILSDITDQMDHTGDSANAIAGPGRALADLADRFDDIASSIGGASSSLDRFNERVTIYQNVAQSRFNLANALPPEIANNETARAGEEAFQAVLRGPRGERFAAEARIQVLNENLRELLSGVQNESLAASEAQAIVNLTEDLIDDVSRFNITSDEFRARQGRVESLERFRATLKGIQDIQAERSAAIASVDSRIDVQNSIVDRLTIELQRLETLADEQRRAAEDASRTVRLQAVQFAISEDRITSQTAIRARAAGAFDNPPNPLRDLDPISSGVQDFQRGLSAETRDGLNEAIARQAAYTDELRLAFGLSHSLDGEEQTRARARVLDLRQRINENDLVVNALKEELGAIEDLTAADVERYEGLLRQAEQQKIVANLVTDAANAVGQFAASAILDFKNIEDAVRALGEAILQALIQRLVVDQIVGAITRGFSPNTTTVPPPSAPPTPQIRPTQPILTFNIDSTDGPGVRAALNEAIPQIVQITQGAFVAEAGRRSSVRRSIRQ